MASFLKEIYGLDTLDTRFTTPSSVPYKTVIDGRDASGKRDAPKPDRKAQPSRWRTPEFYFYYLVFMVSIPFMLWVAYTLSRPSDPRFSKYQHLLSPGWIPGRQIDISDDQYHTFRQNLPYMAMLLFAHPLFRRVWNRVVFPLPASYSLPKPPPEAGDARLEQRTAFDFSFALLLLAALHGFSSLKVLAILRVNYSIATRLPRKYVPWATWIFNIATLFANELSDGYKFAGAARWIAGPPAADLVSDPGALVRLGQWMDSHGGLVPRWEILFNITILRLVSFNLDYYWSLDRRSSSPIEKKQLDVANLSERDRITIPAAPSDFTFKKYIAYVVYAPLYLTGPILTFNDYISQSRYRPASIETPRTVRYAIRFGLVLLTMEVMLHFDYVGAIGKADPQWSSYTPNQLSMLSYFNLHVIWLKLLIPWRLFRLWALVDGIDPPENMLRCVSNNYSTVLFWRGWHRSYNRWLIRYIYVPLGGSDFGSWRRALRSVGTYLLVFTFVALWHDIQLRLLIWGWLIVLFMLPEFTARYLFPPRKWESRPTTYRMLTCAGAVANVLMMMAANLVGFAVGLDGLQSILGGVFQDFWGFIFLVTAYSVLFVGVQVMFEVREAEMRRGVSVKC